ncbi:uncharacterized protein LOC132716130 isoform X2 [Ruditapes philippinarum]|uniref:uncharacterized protein LOC132716130 isoform X2 n=1 Tax=Ruditapes philippinarum TaxID=129788 RepID=UPI00295ADB86|nr:uncharacterized protein LOC132716130 isoform X2 [Ruditapes philippinarum]
MPFGKRGKLERRKGYHKKRVRKAQEKPQVNEEPNDDYFDILKVQVEPSVDNFVILEVKEEPSDDYFDILEVKEEPSADYFYITKVNEEPSDDNLDSLEVKVELSDDNFDVSEVKEESSDDFFRSCFDSGFGNLNGDPFEFISDKQVDNDNLKADEYFLILDKPYQYYEQDDIDALIATETARVFDKLKEEAKYSKNNTSFICNRHSNFIRFVSLYDEDIVKLKVVFTVSHDFTISIQVHEKKLPSSHEIWTVIPSVCYTFRVLERILKIVGSYTTCNGNPDPSFQEFIPYGSYLDANDAPKKQGYRDNYTGKSSIYSTSCHLLTKGTRCKNCNVYRGTLRSLLGRKQKNDGVKTTEIDWLHCRTANSKLTENQKILKLQQLKEYSLSLEKELNVLRKKVSSEIDNKGVVPPENENRDFFHVVKGFSTNENLNECEKDEQKYKMLFWEEQLKYSKLKDKRQMRWHPMLIKWCIMLRSKSGSLYDLLRKSKFISLPSERLLYDYTHVEKNATEFQPETTEVLDSEICGDTGKEENAKRKHSLAPIDATPLPKRKRISL